MKMPDPTWHQRISFFKSFFRILAGVMLIRAAPIRAGLLLILAELLGIVEELV